MLCHFRPTVPNQEAIQFYGQFAWLFDQRLNNAVATFVANFCQNKKTRIPFDQDGDEAVTRHCDQIAFPMHQHGPAF